MPNRCRPSLDIVHQRLPRLFAREEAERAAMKKLALQYRERKVRKSGDLSSQMELVDEKQDLTR